MGGPESPPPPLGAVGATGTPPHGTPRCPHRRPSAMAVVTVLLALVTAAPGAAGTPGASWSAVPRRTVLYEELQDTAKRFSQGGVSHYLTLMLDEAEALLYVGAREAVFALATGTVELKAAISWEAPVEKKAECVQKGKNNQTDCFNYVRFLQSYNSSHLYACGTYAFQPKCTYIELSGFTLDPVAFEDGKGKCPYDPTKGHTGLIVDGELYSATFNNFLGTEPVILRNLGPHYSMKTEYLTSWLNEPHFVASAFVPESAGSGSGDDDKVYFFFSERAVEYDCYAEQVVARVARVCKGDVGGARTLQKKWTSFLKARLVCSAPEQQLHFNRLQAVFTLPGARWQDTAFFGVFQARWGDVDVSAICRYPILEVKKAFEGPYKEYREQAQKWGRYSGEVPTPRPGACITDWHRQNGFASSLELPDNTLNFAKKHPLMDEPVPPQRGRPLLLKRDANFTQLVVDRVAGLDGATYEVLFIGTGDGWVHKALDLGTRIHLVEELQVFEPAQPVESLVLAGTKKLLFAGSRLQVAQLPLAECGRYQSCTDCVLARDPYCAWSRNSSACIRTDGHNGSHLVQDVLSSDTGACSVPQVAKQGPLTPKNVTVVAGTDLVLTCRLASNLARALWTFEGRALAAQQVLVLGEARLRALVVPGAGAQHSGTYRCLAEEQGARLPAQEYRVAVLAGPGAPLETRAPLESLGVVWVLAVCLGALCLLLLLAVLSLWRRLRHELGKGAKAIESTLVYPIELPKEPPSPRFVPSAASDSDEKLWDPSSYYYSDGSLKIVPGHASTAGTACCRNGGPGAASPPAAIPGQPLHSPTRIHLGPLRGSASNGYIRLALGAEERPACADLAEELRRKLQQRQPLPDSNPEESSV
ncbi:semaphorin-4C isoform X2 [Serinus canaria]|uniref:semaphorin-4C isoform X2 n=1 Tax=Serinus canaria TaxID=9135 RepID=UPI0021CC88AC|nr:semaphorin-4C isoform X2 [Serinus canaria]